MSASTSIEVRSAPSILGRVVSTTHPPSPGAGIAPGSVKYNIAFARAMLPCEMAISDFAVPKVIKAAPAVRAEAAPSQAGSGTARRALLRRRKAGQRAFEGAAAFVRANLPSGSRTARIGVCSLSPAFVCALRWVFPCGLSVSRRLVSEFPADGNIAFAMFFFRGTGTGRCWPRGGPIESDSGRSQRIGKPTWRDS